MSNPDIGPCETTPRQGPEHREGDPEAFALCLADGLETWRDFHSRPAQTDAPQQLVAVPLLGLACLAHDRGWHIPVASEYLPARLLDGSWVGTPVLVD